MIKKIRKKSKVMKRKQMFEDMRVTNHWGTIAFPKKPRTYGKELKDFNSFE